MTYSWAASLIVNGRTRTVTVIDDASDILAALLPRLLLSDPRS